MRPSSSTSLPRTIKLDVNRQQDKRSRGTPRRIYYPGKVEAQLSSRPMSSPVSGRPLTAKKLLGSNVDAGNAEAKNSEVKPPADSKELREFELVLERKHDALVSRAEQHLVNALCTASTRDQPQHLPNFVTEGMLNKIEQNQSSMLEQMADITRHSNKSETAVSDLSRTVARLQKKVVTELLQFAAVMSPNPDNAGATTPSSGDLHKYMGKMIQSVTKAVETSVTSQLENVIDRKLKEHLEPLTTMKETMDDLNAKTDRLLQRQAELERTQTAMNDELMKKMMYIQSMIRTLGILSGEFIQMGIEDIASTHRRSVAVIREDITKVGANIV